MLTLGDCYVDTMLRFSKFQYASMAFSGWCMAVLASGCVTTKSPYRETEAGNIKIGSDMMQSKAIGSLIDETQMGFYLLIALSLAILGVAIYALRRVTVLSRRVDELSGKVSVSEYAAGKVSSTED